MSQSEIVLDARSDSAPTSAANSIWNSFRWAISFPALMAALLIGLALVGAQPRLIDPDTWWHVTVGEQILKTHTWPVADTYSFTARGAGWIAYEWLGGVFLALAARAGGLVGLALFQKALVAVFTLLLYYYSYLKSGNSKAACIAATLVLPIAPVAFTLRPQLIGYIFLLLTMICLERFRRGHTRALWFLPPLFIVWANTHGTFVFGLLVMGLYWISGTVNFRAGGLVAERLTERQRVQLLLTFLLCTLALLVTPYGSRIAANPIEMATAQPLNIANIQEWQPLSLSNPVGKFILLFAAALFLAQVVLQLTYRVEEMALLLFAFYASCAHLRFAMIFVLFVAPIVAAILARWTPPYDQAKDRYLLNLALIAMVFFALVKMRPSHRELAAEVASEYPAGAVEYLRQHPKPTGMFNEYGWGGYLISRLGSQHQVFIDGRADLYEYSGVFPDYMVIAAAQPDAVRMLARHNIHSCLVRRGNPLETMLAALPDWKQVYADDLSVIFVRAPRVASNSKNAMTAVAAGNGLAR
jgi:hypothetical protein